MSIQSNKGLQYRMLVTVVLSIVSVSAFLLFIVVTPIDELYAYIFVIGIIVSFALQLYRTLDAGTIDHDRQPQLQDRLERLSQQANMPTPELRIEDTRYYQAANALTYGIFTRRSTVIVTEEMLELLDDQELDAVLAHEIAHIHNKDSTVMSVLASPAKTAVNFCYLPVKIPRLAILLVVFPLIFGPIALLLRFLMRIMSRYREYAADRGSVAITGDKYALISAIQRLTDQDYDEQNRDLRDSHPSAVTFYGETWMQPDPEDRVEKIKQIQMD